MQPCEMEPIPFGSEYPLFNRISIETCGTCTRACWHCPAEQRGKKPKNMSDDLFAKLVNELGRLNFSGVVQLFYVNEPLLDKKWPERYRQLREACPRCTLNVTTNWDTEHKKPVAEQLVTIKKLFDCGVNSLNLNDYDERGYAKLLPEVAKLGEGIVVGDHNWERVGPRKKILSVSLRSTKLHSWGGSTKATMERAPSGKCTRPSKQIVVTWDGRVTACCAVNPEDTPILGDATKQSLVKIWNSKKFFIYRNDLQDGVRKGACKNCVVRPVYPHLARRVSL
jgi:radical SAM protein with 4Fe4S-binding SPASM domain